jgi:hypothetical protein
MRWNPRLEREALGVPLTGSREKRAAEREAFSATAEEWVFGELVWVPDGIQTHCRRANGLHATVYRTPREKGWNVRISGQQGQNPTYHGMYGTSRKARAAAYDLLFPEAEEERSSAEGTSQFWSGRLRRLRAA